MYIYVLIWDTCLLFLAQPFVTIHHHNYEKVQEKYRNLESNSDNFAKAHS
jgi:hypothetical protein